MWGLWGSDVSPCRRTRGAALDGEVWGTQHSSQAQVRLHVGIPLDEEGALTARGRKVGSILVASLGMAACDTGVRPQLDPRVPVAVGHRWEYDGTGTFVLRPETAPDGVDSVIVVRDGSSVEIVGQASIGDTLAAYVFRDSLREDFGRGTDVAAGERWFADRADGLFLHAHRSATLLPPKPRAGMRRRIAGREFASFAEVRETLRGSRPASTDSLFFEQPPLPQLRYPLRLGDRWTYRNAGDPWRIQLEVVGLEWTVVPAGEYLCARVDWHIDLDDDGTWDDNIVFSEHVSTIGVVRQDLRMTGVELLDAKGNWLGTADSHEFFALTRFRTASSSP